MPKTYAEVIDAMKQRAAQQPTELLCQALEMLAARPLAELDDAERRTRAVLIDTLTERHPEADAAFQAWAESDDADADSGVREIVAAARATAAS